MFFQSHLALAVLGLSSSVLALPFRRGRTFPLPILLLLLSFASAETLH